MCRYNDEHERGEVIMIEIDEYEFSRLPLRGMLWQIFKTVQECLRFLRRNNVLLQQLKRVRIIELDTALKLGGDYKKIKDDLEAIQPDAGDEPAE